VAQSVRKASCAAGESPSAARSTGSHKVAGKGEPVRPELAVEWEKVIVISLATLDSVAVP
jgi:hypothetical protein